MASKLRDGRIAFNYRRFVAADGNVRHFDGKLDLAKGVFKIYRIHGSIENPTIVIEALAAIAQEHGAGVFAEASGSYLHIAGVVGGKISA